MQRTCPPRPTPGLWLALAAALLVPRPSSPQQAARDPLAADAAVGRVVDREGVAGRRGVLADRWGPADEATRLEPGDWLRTGSRGANALALRLSSGAGLTLGPGGLLEVVDATRVVLTDGELALRLPEGLALDVGGPGGSSLRATGRAVLRAHDGNLTRLEEDPRWLVGYEGNASTEALGSLLCEIDGRNVPLTMGYHQVTVEIRDQIARTVIEESFENHTEHVLEGVFYFPLPAGASISGFGMWIGGELVQGEIVEQERARAIYETILREKRDPGLLEWAGGNVFKARVYPIGSEKRIRIAYTQVLPKRGDTYAYHYALQSDLLRQHPLKRLRVQVDVHSSQPLLGVASPSHDCRVRVAEHSARVELEAEDYAPDRDFELRVGAAAPAGAVTLVPHRRGDDGYFMLLFDAPAAPAAPQRAAEPLELLVLADTSGSTWGPPREAQVAFVEALLGALGERDTFTLATCDVETRFAFERPQPSTARAREDALRFLEAREPLGWSDLDAAFRAACERAGPRTQVVYVGDGAPTAGDPDPLAFARRLERLYRGQGTFHAVVPGSRSEELVLDAIASLGGGSWRAIGGGSDPATVAFELLEELTTPAVKDLRLAFEGLEVAAVHPARLPNLPAGRQHVVLGRFDPAGGDLTGRVRVTGSLAGAPVELAADVRIAAADEGNSFVPRLWARRHLDHLLAQGRSKEVRERVIALSEDFQILTPYTSFLVLESDADRERFQVEKRFRMRDGEEFFAQGREAARHELARQQMLAARNWRRRLQARVLAALSDMERERTRALSDPSLLMPEDRRQLRSLGYVSAGLKYGSADDFYMGRGESAQQGNELLAFDDGDLLGEDAWDAPEEELPAGEPALDEDLEAPRLERVAKSTVAGPASPGPLASSLEGGRAREQGAGLYRGPGDTVPPGRYDRRAPQDPFASLLPSVPAPPEPAAAATWPDEVARLLARLDHRAAVAAASGGFALEVQRRSWDARGREWTARSNEVLGADAWVQRALHAAGGPHYVQWLVDAERGLWLAGWRLGRTRPAEPGDARGWSPPIEWWFGDRLRGWAQAEARLEDLGDGRARISLSQPQAPQQVLSLVLERERALLLEQSWSQDGEVTQRTTFDGFREVGGAWWPTSSKAFGEQDELVAETTIEVEALAPADLARRLAVALEGRADALLLGPLPEDVQAAKQAAREGAATLEDRWRLLSYFASTQRWDLAAPHLAAVEQLARGKPGLVAVHAAWLSASRQGEELKAHLMRAAADLAAAEHEAELGPAAQLVDFGSRLQAGQERLALLLALEPVYARHAHVPDAALPWDRQVVQSLEEMGRATAAFERWARMARDYPYTVDVQGRYAQELARHGKVDEAVAWLAAAEREHGPWQDHELQALRRSTLDVLWSSYRLEQLVETCEGWQREEPSRVDSQVALRYLSALVLLDREERAWGLATQWLGFARERELSTLRQALLQAAVQHGLGRGHQLYYRAPIEDERAELLARTALLLADNDDLPWMTGQILQDYRMTRTDAARAALERLMGEVEAGVEELPAQRLQRFVSWLRGAGVAPAEGVAGEAAWEAIFERVYARWLASAAPVERGTLEQIVVSQGPRALVLRLRRRVLEEAEAGAPRVAAAQQLFQALQQEPWSTELEDELFALLPALALEGDVEAAAAEQNLDQRILALYDLSGWLPLARARVAVESLPDVNSMPRRLLKAASAEALREARAATARRLGALEDALEPEALCAWAGIERVWLDVRLGTDLERARRFARERLEALLAAHPVPPEDGRASDVALRDHVLAARCAATLTWLLTRAPEDLRAAHEGELAALFQGGAAADPDLIDWRELEYVRLLVLDRGEELVRTLEDWFADGDDLAQARWGRDRAWVLAEQGLLEEAVASLRALERLDELGHDDYRALGDWLTVLDRPEEARAARIASWEVLGERQLGNRVHGEVGAWSRTGDEPPPELDPELPLRFIALLRKAPYPQNRLWPLQQVYAATKDFRLLECVPEGVLGHSSQGVYPFLESAGSLFELVQEEAAVDRLRTRLVGLREAAATGVDRRALALLEFALLRRAADQSHGTERHAEGALAALRAVDRSAWTDGEPLLMAGFLAGQGVLRPEALAEEQLRLMGELRAAAADETERLEISGHLARTLWSYGRQEEAARLLEGALAALRAASEGLLPRNANSHLETLGGWLQTLGSWREAELLWTRELDCAHPLDQRLWLVEQLHELYRDAVLARADLSLGAGRELYPAVVRSFARALEPRTNERHAEQLVSTLCQLFVLAHRDLRLPQATEDATRFAFGELPAVLDRYQYRNGQDMVRAVAQCLRVVRDPRTTLEFLVGRAENEPRWLRLVGQDFWPRQAGELAELRHQVGELPAPLEERLLALVLRALRQDLLARESRNRAMYDARHSWFWREKREDFRRAALAVLAERRDSGPTIEYAAEYLFRGLDAHEEAIDALLAAHARGVLQISGRRDLCAYLQERERWRESVPLLAGLVADQPGAVDLRVMQMRAHFHLGDGERLVRALEAATAWLVEHDQWTEQPIAQLAHGCVETQLHERGAQLWDEAIELHVKSAPGRGVGDGVLSGYYRSKSQALASLGRLDEAVDAAAGAIVSWGRDLGSRADELANLQRILAQAEDLDGYVARLEAEVARSGMENPILRKALGRVLLERRRYDDAARHLRLALDAQTDDAETHQLLVSALDRARRGDLAAQATLERARTAAHEVGLWVDLGRRLARLERQAEAERAFTSLAEAMPDESEGHQALAEVRQEQQRWEEAATSWRQVARVRSQEPTGWLGLADCLLRLERWDEAREVVERLLTTPWPERFGDVRQRAESLRERLPRSG